MKALPLVAVLLIGAVIGLMLWRGNLGAWDWAEVVGLAIGSVLILVDAVQRRRLSEPR